VNKDGQTYAIEKGRNTEKAHTVRRTETYRVIDIVTYEYE